MTSSMLRRIVIAMTMLLELIIVSVNSKVNMFVMATIK